jgi:hypothetical protein
LIFKDNILGWINHYESGVAEEKIKEWKETKRQPVFVIEDGQPVIVSHTYKDPSYDFEDKGQFSYWKDHNYEYKSGIEYYNIWKIYDKGSYKLTLNKSKKHGPVTLLVVHRI